MYLNRDNYRKYLDEADRRITADIERIAQMYRDRGQQERKTYKLRRKLAAIIAEKHSALLAQQDEDFALEVNDPIADQLVTEGLITET